MKRYNKREYLENSIVRVTLKTIAEKAGVSVSLVSMHLNHHPLSERIADETRKRIDAAVKELNYRPSITARTLRNGKSRTIGLVIGQIAGIYSSFCSQSLLHEAIKYNYQLLISVTRFKREEELECLESLIDRQTDGILYNLYLKPEPQMADYLKHYPILQLSSASPDFNSLLPDIETPIAEAIRDCLSRGKRRLAGLFDDADPYNIWYSTFRTQAEQHCADYSCLDMRNFASCEELHQAIQATGAQTVFSGASTVVFKLLRYYAKRGIRHHPEFIYSYTLPTDYSAHPAVAGIIVNPFKEQITQSIQCIIRMIETKQEKCEQWRIPAIFMKGKEIRAYYEEQKEDPYFDTLVNEWDMKHV